jgi:hypothetical protein
VLSTQILVNVEVEVVELDFEVDMKVRMVDIITMKLPHEGFWKNQLYKWTL